jgi:putative MATE family efflux protein
MLSMLFQTLYNAVDAFWVSKISPNAIAAVSISQITLFLMISLSMGITAGSGVLMAMSIGRRDIAEAERILGQSFVLSAIAGIVFTAVSLIFRRPLLVASGATGDILPLALEYFTVTAGGSMLIFLLVAVFFAFSSQGDNKTVTLLFSVSTAVNAALDPIMIFGWAGFPAMGVSGAAVATVFSQLIILVAALFILKNADMMVVFKFSRLGLRWQSVKRVMNIGFPAALTNVVGPLSLAALTAIISARFLEAGAISFSIGFRVEFFAYLPAVGFGVAALALLGQNAGARHFDRVRAAYRGTLLLGFSAATLFGLLVVLFRNQIIGIFTTDRQVADYSRMYFLTVPFSYGMFAMVFVEIFSLQGVGRSWSGFTLALARIAAAIPAAYVLLHVLRLPLYTAWIAIVGANAAAAALGFRWVRANLEKVSSNPVTPYDTAESEWAGASMGLEPEGLVAHAREAAPLMPERLQARLIPARGTAGPGCPSPDRSHGLFSPVEVPVDFPSRLRRIGECT